MNHGCTILFESRDRTPDMAYRCYEEDDVLYVENQYGNGEVVNFCPECGYRSPSAFECISGLG